LKRRWAKKELKKQNVLRPMQAATNRDGLKPAATHKLASSLIFGNSDAGIVENKPLATVQILGRT
jgi:hypothetical protein